MEILNKIDELAAELNAMRPLNDAELSRLREEFIIDNTYNSNAIEGSTLTLRETALILQEGVTVAGKHIREHLDAIGHKEAFEYIIELAEKGAPLTEHVIKDLHTLVLMSDRQNAGVYRRLPVQILGAKHAPPPPYLVPEQMEKLIAWYTKEREKKHIIEAVAEFHLRFEGIHPFIDGNGRTGRLILNLELVKSGLLPINVKFSDRARYYACFDSYYGAECTAKPMIEMLAEYETAELEKRLTILRA